MTSGTSKLQSHRRLRQIYLTLDWDGTITRRDTMAVLAGLGYKRRQTLHNQDRLLTTIQPWDHFVLAYLTDYNRHLASYKPVKRERRSIADESAWLASLETIEKASFERVNRAGLFQEVTLDDLNNEAKLAIQEKRVELRPGWEELLIEPSHESCLEVRIASVNWSASFIRACIAAALEFNDEQIAKQLVGTGRGILSATAIHANEVVRTGSSTEEPESRFHVAANKAQLLKALRTSSGRIERVGRSETRQNVDLDTGGDSLIIFVGDSATDFDCLIEADVGICIQDEPLSSSQTELKETLARVGFSLGSISNFDPEDLSLGPSETRGKIIWIARDLREVSKFVKEVTAHSRLPKSSQPSSFPTTYSKHFIPLESDPEIFTELAHSLGLSTQLEFHDVLSLDDPQVLAMVPRPVYAMILVFPTSEAYERQKKEEETSRDDYAGSGEEENVIWFRQTINNACGLYGLLHAVCNSPASNFLEPNSHLACLLASSRPLKPLDRAKLLETDENLESAYNLAASKGSSTVPDDPSSDVDYHYICFIKSSRDGHLYELDGDKRGPVDRGPAGDTTDLLAEDCLGIVQNFVRRDADLVGFGLMALAHNN